MTRSADTQLLADDRSDGLLSLATKLVGRDKDLATVHRGRRPPAAARLADKDPLAVVSGCWFIGNM